MWHWCGTLCRSCCHVFAPVPAPSADTGDCAAATPSAKTATQTAGHRRLLGRLGQLPTFRSLRLTLLLSIVVPLIIASGVAIYLGLGAVERNLNQRLQEDLELVARAVSGPLSQAMSEGDDIVMGEFLESIFRIGRVYGASVFDARGDLVAKLGVADTDVTRSESAGKAIASGELGGAFRQVNGVPVFSQFTPWWPITAGSRDCCRLPASAVISIACWPPAGSGR